MTNTRRPSIRTSRSRRASMRNRRVSHSLSPRQSAFVETFSDARRFVSTITVYKSYFIFMKHHWKIKLVKLLNCGPFQATGQSFFLSATKEGDHRWACFTKWPCLDLLPPTEINSDPCLIDCLFWFCSSSSIAFTYWKDFLKMRENERKAMSKSMSCSLVTLESIDLRNGNKCSNNCCTGEAFVKYLLSIQKTHLTDSVFA